MGLYPWGWRSGGGMSLLYMPRPTVPYPTGNCCPCTKLVAYVANDLFKEFPLPVNERDGNLVGKGLWVITVI